MREALARQVLVRDHALGLDEAIADREHLVEGAHIETPARADRAVAEEVRGFLRERDRSAPCFRLSIDLRLAACAQPASCPTRRGASTSRTLSS